MMAPNPYLMAAGAAGGGLSGYFKHQKEQHAEDADRAQAAQITKYSPWTGMQAAPVKRAGSQFGDIATGMMGGAATGASIGQTMGTAGDTREDSSGGGGGSLGVNTNLQNPGFNQWMAMNQPQQQNPTIGYSPVAGAQPQQQDPYGLGGTRRF